MWFGIVGLGIIIVVAVTFWATSTSENAFSKVKPGMTRREVDTLVGGHPALGYGKMGWEEYMYDGQPRLWHQSKTLVVSLSGSPYQVTRVQIQEPGPDNRSLLERVQDEYRYQKSKLGW
jgi:hypothetical protein